MPEDEAVKFVSTVTAKIITYKKGLEINQALVEVESIRLS
jgi:hypothetical protein